MVDFVIPEGSSLGTKEYWDQHYSQELNLFDQNGDCGEVWFGTRREDQLINWILLNISNPAERSFLDIGCGNGHLLHSLYKKTHSTQLFGLDYSENSLKLAEKYLLSSDTSATLFLFDLLTDYSKQQISTCQNVDVVIDKGTFDAICLFDDSTDTNSAKVCNDQLLVNSIEESTNSRVNQNYTRIERIKSQIVPKYLDNIAKFMNADGIFIIASCNWTFVELKEFFTSSNFRLVEEIRPTEQRGAFMFGGAVGNSVTCAAFAKN